MADRTAGTAAQREFKRGLHICTPFRNFKKLDFFDHFYVFVFKAIFENFLILFYAVLRKNEGVKYLQGTSFSQPETNENLKRQPAFFILVSTKITLTK